MPFLKDYPQLQIIRDIARRRKVSVRLVGGFLRDYCLGQPKKDFDFAVEKDALAFARVFARQIKGAYVLLDQERGCARVVKKGGGQIWTFDFADLRAKSFRQDLALRDFTINTLSADLEQLSGPRKLEEVLADYKNGLKDLRAGRIRRVSTRAFRDDPLRLLRAFSLSATLGFRIAAQTLAQIRRESNRLRSVSYERIRDELFKVLETGRAAATLKAMDKVALLDKVIPQIKVMYNCKQRGTYHHLDVWPHSLEAVVQFEGVVAQTKDNPDVVAYLDGSPGGGRSRRALIKLALVLHDIGKPQTQRIEGKGRMTFYGHERVGRDITNSVAKMLKISTGERHALEDMVLWHLRPGYLSNFKKPGEKAIYRYLRDTREEAAAVALLSLADQRATRGPLTTAADQRHHERVCLDLVKRYFDKKKEKPFVRLVNGHDVMKHLRLPASPLIGKILTEVAEQQVLGRVTAKKEALELAGKIAAAAPKTKMKN
ncbi:MAG: CCA tRNA nucleotidyltransferase [Candidatus Omnitrophica bacterium]|nr:CCA tRNA nucleotidyltransferase [Candidatus Omnitrophota bacterium]